MLRIFVLICALIAVTCGNTVAKSDDRSGRIVGGNVASNGQFPYVASLRSGSNIHFAVAFIISNRYVGTAAHSLIGRATTNTVTVVGTNSRVFGGIVHQTQRFVIHPQYNGQNLANDIAMVQTRTPIAFNNLARAIPFGTAVQPGIQATTAGWGQTSYPGFLADNLMFMTAPTLTNADCANRHLPEHRHMVHPNNVCTFLRAGVGMCLYDSGAPLIAMGSVVGSFSWSRACALGSPDVFTRIQPYRQWMINNMT